MQKTQSLKSIWLEEIDVPTLCIILNALQVPGCTITFLGFHGMGMEVAIKMATVLTDPDFQLNALGLCEIGKDAAAIIAKSLKRPNAQIIPLLLCGLTKDELNEIIPVLTGPTAKPIRNICLEQLEEGNCQLLFDALKNSACNCHYEIHYRTGISDKWMAKFNGIDARNRVNQPSSTLVNSISTMSAQLQTQENHLAVYGANLDNVATYKRPCATSRKEVALEEQLVQLRLENEALRRDNENQRAYIAAQHCYAGLMRPVAQPLASTSVLPFNRIAVTLPVTTQHFPQHITAPII